jgi:hypothetical protein
MSVLAICLARVDVVEIVDAAAHGITLNDLKTHGENVGVKGVLLVAGDVAERMSG